MKSWSHISSLAEQAIAEAEIRTEYPEIRGLSTGIAEVDERLSPALEAGRMIVIAGESGKGKTALAAQLAVAFAHQVPVLWMSLEDSEVDATRRALANASRLPVSGFRSGFRIGSVPDSARAGAEILSNLPLYISGETADVVGLAQRTGQWIAENGINGPLRGVLIIDQLSHLLMTPPDPDLEDRMKKRGLPLPPRARDAEHKVLEWQVAIIREIAVRFQMCVILLHQLNQVRDDSGRPTESSIRGSQGIVHKSDAVLIPWRPKKIGNPFAGPGQPTTMKAGDDDAEIICVKGRVVPQFVVKVRWDGAHQRFCSPSETVDQQRAYEAPEGFSDRALEGVQKLADLRAKLERQRMIERRTAGEITTGDPE